MFDIDLRTLSASVALVQVASVLFSLILYASRQTFDGARLWITGQAVMALGGIMLTLRWSMPPIVAIFVSNLPYLAAPLFFFHSLWVFWNHGRFPYWIYLFIPLVVGLYTLDLSPDIRLRATVFSVASIISNSAAAVISAYRRPRHYRLPAYLLSGTFVLVVVGHAMRLVSFATNGPVVYSEQGQLSELAYFLSMLSAFFFLFGYYLLSSVRFEREKLDKETRLEEQNQWLLRVNDTITTLVSVIGHDVKAPIASASRYMKRFLVDTPETIEERRKALGTIEQTLDSTQQLLEDLVVFTKARIQEGKARLGRLDLVPVLEECRKQLEPELEGKDVTLIVDIPDEARFVLSEQTALTTVVRNVISNAVKFSYRGGRIDVRSASRNGHNELCIIDYGCGMPDSHLRKILEEGRILSTHGTEGERGHGMGMALIRTAAAQIDVNLQVFSEVDKGTEVRLEFPSAIGRISP